MKIKDLLRILQAAPEKDKEVWIPSTENERTTNIGFNFDDINNLELYEMGGENCEKYVLNTISDLEKLHFKDKINEAYFELKQLQQKISELEKT